MKLIPAEDRIVIKREVQEKVGAIFIPVAHQGKSTIGKVIAISAKEEWLKVGDSILFETYSGQNIEIEKEEYTILKTSEVLAKVEEKDG